MTVPFHSGENLHPKIIKQVLEMIEDAGESAPIDDHGLTNAVVGCKAPHSNPGRKATIVDTDEHGCHAWYPN